MLLKNINVLYAEDEEGIRSNIVDILELYVNNVYAASNGEEALEYYNLYNPNVIILDICMPKMDGLEALRHIRKKDLKTPVIMLTAHTEEKYLLDAVELYITKYLLKPFNKSALLGALNECLNHFSIAHGEVLAINDILSYNFSNGTLIENNEEIKLTKKEILFFELLVKRSPTIVTKEELELHVWDGFDVSMDAFKSLLKDIRKKVGNKTILNRQGVGYYIQLKNS